MGRPWHKGLLAILLSSISTTEHNANSTGDVNSKKLDAWLRERLRTEVPAGLVEAAFEQVMKLVFAT